MTEQPILYTVDNHVAHLTLNRPDRMNALNADLLGQLIQQLDDIVESDARALVITGSGKAFCAGADLQGDITDASDDNPVDLSVPFERWYRPLANRLRDYPMPTVAAVNGAAAGFGMSLAVLCDMVVMSDQAKMSAAFSKIGLVPDGGWTYVVPRVIGKARAMEMAFLAESIDAQTALNWGLVNQIAAPGTVVDEATTLAERLANGPASLTGIRRLIWHGMNESWEEQLDAESEAQGEAGRTADFVEGVKAFISKRAPKFLGF